MSNLKTAKNIMSSAAWINRLPPLYYFTDATFGKPIGLLFSNGNDWKEARKLCFKLLHQLDFFRSRHIEGFISFEIAQVENDLQKRIQENGAEELTMCPHQMFELATLNILYQVIMNKRLSMKILLRTRFWTQ